MKKSCLSYVRVYLLFPFVFLLLIPFASFWFPLATKDARRTPKNKPKGKRTKTKTKNDKENNQGKNQEKAQKSAWNQEGVKPPLLAEYNFFGQIHFSIQGERLSEREASCSQREASCPQREAEPSFSQSDGKLSLLSKRRFFGPRFSRTTS
jgi:hypothetical protein